MYHILPDGQFTFHINEGEVKQSPKKTKTKKSKRFEVEKLIVEKNKEIEVLKAWITIYKDEIEKLKKRRSNTAEIIQLNPKK